ncbi:hypothetical protein BBJ28_00021243, partial [Nothophytophthora sp. Chile5]
MPSPWRTLLAWLLLFCLHGRHVAGTVYAEDGFDPLRQEHEAAEEPSGDNSGNHACEVDEIQLASDGTIAQWGLERGTRVAPNMTVNGTVTPEAYHFYHLCVARHEHEHLITVRLQCDHDDVSEGDANLYLSSEYKYPRMGHSTWISQGPGDELVKLYTYLDGFPRKSEEAGSRWIALHIGVFGAGDIDTRFDLSVSVTDLPITPDIQSREEFYTQRHLQDRKQRLRGTA